MSQLRFIRSLLAALALGAPFVLVAQLSAAGVAPLTGKVVGVLLRLSAPLSPPEAAAVDPAELDVAAPSALSFDSVTQVASRKAPKAPPKAKPSALFVSQATVLKLSQSAVRPRGSFVPASAAHPAGLRLSGVAPLGIGVRDGDILIEALGITPRAAGEIIGAIIEARAQNVRFLSGTLWREGQTFRITVEQPYLPLAPSAVPAAG